MSRIIRGGQIENLHFNPIPEDSADDVNPDGLISSDSPQGKAMLDDATTKAEGIIRSAEERAQLIEHEAYQRGYEQGLDFARSETAEMVEIIKSMAEQAVQEKWKFVNDVETNIVDLAVQIAEKIVGKHIESKPDVVIDVAKRALLMAAEREHIQIRVNPDDVDVVKIHKDDLIATMDGIQKIEVIPDRRVGRGGCVFETSAGNVDARVQSQISQIEQSLRGVVIDD
ncbi:MAG: FliH/SctL family protein [Candidatus Aquicultor sp.]